LADRTAKMADSPTKMADKSEDALFKGKNNFKIHKKSKFIYLIQAEVWIFRTLLGEKKIWQIECRFWQIELQKRQIAPLKWQIGLFITQRVPV
jgi:hypothetical protein